MKSVIKSKKGQVSALPVNITFLMIGAVILTLGIIITAEMRDSDVVAKGQSGYVVNETLSTVNDKGDTLTAATAPAAYCTITTVTNRTSGTVIPSTNYSQATNNNTHCTLVFTDGTATNFNNSDWNVTYTYTFGDTAYVQANASIQGMGTFADFWIVIVLAIVAAIVIGIILGGFGKKAR